MNKNRRYKFRHARKFRDYTLNYSASEQVVPRAISLTSMVLLAIIVCLQNFYDIAAPPNMNTNPVVDFTLSELVT